MIHAIAFFPWVAIGEPLIIGPLRLLPFKLGAAPDSLPCASQKDIDSVLSAYATHPGQPIVQATLMEIGDWRTGQDLGGHLEALFKISRYVTFAGLAERELFRNTGYCNADTYRLVVQRYKSGEAGEFVYSSRRRDGNTLRAWGSDEYAFHCPHHVDPLQLRIDVPLLTALLSAPVAGNVDDAIAEFNNANTDAIEVAEHTEMVMAKSAFECLWEINQNAHSMEKALEIALAKPPLQRTSWPPGPEFSAWRKRWPNGTLAAGWARDFCAVRGVSAHGKKGGVPVWRSGRHLALASWLFPLLVKQHLSEAGIYHMTDRDWWRLGQFEGFLMDDPLGAAACKPGTVHPWVRLGLMMG